MKKVTGEKRISIIGLDFALNLTTKQKRQGKEKKKPQKNDKKASCQHDIIAITAESSTFESTRDS